MPTQHNTTPEHVTTTPENMGTLRQRMKEADPEDVEHLAQYVKGDAYWQGLANRQRHLITLAYTKNRLEQEIAYKFSPEPKFTFFLLTRLNWQADKSALTRVLPCSYSCKLRAQRFYVKNNPTARSLPK